MYKPALFPRTDRLKYRLEKHIKQHASQASKICLNCHTSFNRVDHFQNHKIVCDNNNQRSKNDEQFTPSFAGLDNSIIEFVETATTDSPLILSSPIEYKLLIVMLNWKMLFLIR